MSDIEAKTESLDLMTDRTSAVCHWVKRSYEASKKWEQLAVDVYREAEGDSCLARTILASSLRAYFVDGKPQAETIRRWKEGCDGQEELNIKPPKVGESNASYVDWLYVADYLLLPCSSLRDDFDELNTVRKSQYRALFQSFQLRSYVVKAIEILEERSRLSDEEIVDLLKSESGDDDVKPSLATVKEAKRWTRADEKPRKIEAPVEPAYLGLYEPLYFKSNEEF